MSAVAGGPPPRQDQYWLLWDGECGFCGRAAQWALAHSRPGLLAVLPYQQAPSPPMDAALAAACRRAVHLRHPDGRLERAGGACLTLLELAGYPRSARCLRRRPLVWAVELGYWCVARKRKWFSALLFRARP